MTDDAVLLMDLKMKKFNTVPGNLITMSTLEPMA